MQSDPAHPTGQANLLRQQVILSQVRIMELEDTCTELTARRDELNRLLAGVQSLADEELAEITHLRKIQTELQAEVDHGRHLLHVSNAGWEQTRQELASVQHALKQAEQALVQRLRQIEQGAAESADLHRQLQQAHAQASLLSQRIAELAAERRAMKLSRSWRWTAWLRSIERVIRKQG